MNIETFDIITSMGISTDIEKLYFLTPKEKENLDTVGYTGKLNGIPTSRETYLNTLNKGTFKVEQTQRDNGDFCERFKIIRVTKSDNTNSKSETLNSYLKGKTIKSVSLNGGVVSVETTDGFELNTSGGNLDTTYCDLMYVGQDVIKITESF